MEHSELKKELETFLGEAFVDLSEEQQEKCVELYESKRRGHVIYFFWFLNFHYAYVHMWSMFIVFFFTLGGLGIWWLIDLFRIITILNKANKKLAVRIVEKIQGEDVK